MIRRGHIFEVAVIAVVVFCAQIARCDTITVTNLSQDAFTGVYQYEVETDASTVLNPGDGFVIYDFPGYVSSTLALAGFGAPTQDLIYNGISAPAPSDVTLTPNTLDVGLTTVLGLSDNPTIGNLSFVYSGPTVGEGNGKSAVLTIYSSIAGASATTAVSGVASKDSGGVNSKQLFFGYAIVPGANSSSVTTATPLPSPVWAGGLMMSLIAGAGFVRKLRWKSSVLAG